MHAPLMYVYSNEQSSDTGAVDEKLDRRDDEWLSDVGDQFRGRRLQNESQFSKSHKRHQQSWNYTLQTRVLDEYE